MRCWVRGTAPTASIVAAAAKGRPRTKVRRHRQVVLDAAGADREHRATVECAAADDHRRPSPGICISPYATCRPVSKHRRDSVKLRREQTERSGRRGGAPSSAEARGARPLPPGHRASAQPQWRAAPGRAETSGRAGRGGAGRRPSRCRRSGRALTWPSACSSSARHSSSSRPSSSRRSPSRVQLAREHGRAWAVPGSRLSFSRRVSCSNPKAKTICGSAPVSAARSSPVVATASQCASPCSHESRRHASARTRSTSITRR